MLILKNDVLQVLSAYDASGELNMQQDFICPIIGLISQSFDPAIIFFI